jgi:hypothetical protein
MMAKVRRRFTSWVMRSGLAAGMAAGLRRPRIIWRVGPAACEAAGQGDRVPEPLAVNEP